MKLAPEAGGAALLLAKAVDDQVNSIGRQAAGRVGFFLEVSDFDAAYARMGAAGVVFERRRGPKPTAGSSYSTIFTATAGTCSRRPARIIPALLKTDTRPLARSDGSDAVRIVGEEAPGALAGVEDLVVGFPDEGAEGVLAQIRPDVLHRVQLG